jgi:hypothetical protein
MTQNNVLVLVFFLELLMLFDYEYLVCFKLRVQTHMVVMKEDLIFLLGEKQTLHYDKLSEEAR